MFGSQLIRIGSHVVNCNPLLYIFILQSRINIHLPKYWGSFSCSFHFYCTNAVLWAALLPFLSKPTHVIINEVLKMTSLISAAPAGSFFMCLGSVQHVSLQCACASQCKHKAFACLQFYPYTREMAEKMAVMMWRASS